MYFQLKDPQVTELQDLAGKIPQDALMYCVSLNKTVLDFILYIVFITSVSVRLMNYPEIRKSHLSLFVPNLFAKCLKIGTEPVQNNTLKSESESHFIARYAKTYLDI